MFSQDDISEIHGLFPPEKQLRSETSEGLPLLIKTSGHGFVTAHSLQRNFERLATAGASRVDLSAVSSQLDVEVDVPLQLCRANPTLALLTQDGNGMLNKTKRDSIVEGLRVQLAEKLVLKADFIQSHDLHKDSLGSILQISDIEESLAENTEEYLLSKQYSTALANAVHQKLEAGLDSTDSTELRPRSLPGTPPLWLIKQCFHSLRGPMTNEADVISQFHIEEEDDVIRCMPKKSLICQRDELLAQLQSGERFYLRIDDFRRSFRELYPSLDALNKHLSDLPSITIIADFAVSEAKLATIVDDAGQRLRDEECLDMTTILPHDVPHEIADAVRMNIMQRIRKGTSDDGTDNTLERGDYMVTKLRYAEERHALLSLAKQQAQRQWEALGGNPDKEPKFQMAEVVAAIPDEKPLLRAVAQGKEDETAAAEQFAIEISGLESKNENDFSNFWTEKVSLRVSNHREGLKAVEDAKLHEQLSELLSGYLKKDLVPDTISKARSQGLVCSKRTRKNVNRFEATLKTSKNDLSSVLSTLDKFSKKQDLPEIDSTAAEEGKKTLIQDMVRRMQKPKADPVIMFLSLVIYLFAKHHPGVVYATGKFAPKLLKLLKTKLEIEDYERVEKWKEQVKAGTVTKEDREAMIKMVEKAL